MGKQRKKEIILGNNIIISVVNLRAIIIIKEIIFVLLLWVVD